MMRAAGPWPGHWRPFDALLRRAFRKAVHHGSKGTIRGRFNPATPHAEWGFCQLDSM